MNVLVTGGSGLIGRALVADLIERGHAVTVLTRNPHRTASLLPPEADARFWDGRTLKGWSHLISQCEAVINLAGETIAGENPVAIFTRRWTPAVKTRIRESRVRIGALLSEAIAGAEHKPRVLMQASAVGYYGNVSDHEVTEDAPPGEDFLAQVCREWEASTASVEELGIRRLILRTGLVLAREGGIMPVMLLPVRLFVGGPLGSGEQAIPWIHLADEVAAIRFLLENEAAAGPYNLSAPNPVTQREFARTAAAVLKRPAFLPIPAFVLRLVLGEKAQLVLEGQRALPKRLLQAGFEFHFPSLRAALEDLLRS